MFHIPVVQLLFRGKNGSQILSSGNTKAAMTDDDRRDDFSLLASQYAPVLHVTVHTVPPEGYCA